MLLAEFSHLNLISVLGIFVMLALAYFVSSNRKAVRWRLVAMGLGLQITLAALFFNSQRWTFPKTFDSFAALAEASDSGTEKEPKTPEWAADQMVINQSFDRIFLDERCVTFADLQQAIENQWVTKEEAVAAIGSEISVPRFPRGVVFYAVESFFSLIQNSVYEGSKFVFQVNPDDVATENKTHPRAILTTFAFGVLPTVIFFAALMSVLYYLGVMQKLIRIMAWIMQKTLGVSGAESLAAAANVLVGHTEAPLVVKPYIGSMTRSELNALMVGGFATISGSLMAIFAGMGVSAGHMLSASIISAPAALVLAKIMQPETGTPKSAEAMETEMENNATNLLQAAANGASEGMKLALNIGAMLIAFLALITFIDILLQGFGGLIGIQLSLSRIFGIVLYPLAWVMGIESKDCMVAGDLLGQKMVVNEFVAYLGLIGDAGVGLSERTRVILTYALCGFSNFGAIGIQLGGIGPLAPNRKNDLAQLGLRAMFGGMLACCMTACIAGVMYGILR